MFQSNQISRKNSVGKKKNNYDNKQIRELIQIQLNTKNRIIKLDNQKVKDEDFQIIFQMIGNQQLKSLSLKKNLISDYGVEIMCKMLLKSNIKLIDLSNNNLSF